MPPEKAIHELKYSRFQAISVASITFVVIEPIRRAIIQGIKFHEYYWFVLSFLLAVVVFWNFTRIGIHALWGIPAIVLTDKGITLTQLGYHIVWEDIDGIDLIENPGKYTTYSLAISVNDDWKYMSAIRNPVLRYYRWYSRQLYNNRPSFSISLNLLSDDSNDIYAMVENCFHNYKNKSIYGR